MSWAWPGPAGTARSGGLHAGRPASVTARRAASALRLLGRFGLVRAGWPARSAECLLDYDVIEAILRGGAARVPGTGDAGHVPVGAVRAARPKRGTGRPGLAAGAVPGREAAGAVLAGRAGGAGRGRGRAARRGETRPRRWRWWCSGSARGCGPGELVALRGGGVTRHGGQVDGCMSAGRQRGWCRSPRATPAAPGSWPSRAGSGHRVPARPGRPRLQELRQPASPGAWRLTRPRRGCRCAGPGPAFICGHLAAGTPVGVLLAITGIAEAGSLARYARHVGGISCFQGRPAGALARGAHAVSGGRPDPAAGPAAGSATRRRPSPRS